MDSDDDIEPVSADSIQDRIAYGHEYCAKAQETANVIMLYQALQSVLQAAQDAHTRKHMLEEGLTFGEAFAKTLHEDIQVTMAPALVVYLLQGSRAIAELADGRDFRDQPRAPGFDPFTDRSPEARRYFDDCSAYHSYAKQGGRPLTPREAKELVSSALGFSRRGHNAFARYRQSKVRVDKATSMESDEQEGGRTPAEARRIVMERMGYQDPRDYRRFIAGKPRGKKGGKRRP